MSFDQKNRIIDLLHYFFGKVLLYLFLVCLFIIVTISLVRINFGIGSVLFIIDSYLRLILSSWPACILFVSVFILTKHHDSISYFIKNRMTGIGPDGIKGSVLTTSASDVELKTKTIIETLETDKETKNIERSTNASQRVSMEKNAPESHPTIIKEANIDRYTKVSKIESIIQTSLIEKYGDRYKPQIKLSIEGKNIIIDGVLYSKKSGKATAIEIKYISSKNYDALRFIIARFKEKLYLFGIRRLIVIVVGENLLQEDAIKIQEANLNLAKIYFYRTKDNGDLEEVELPSRREEHLF